MQRDCRLRAYQGESAVFDYTNLLMYLHQLFALRTMINYEGRSKRQKLTAKFGSNRNLRELCVT